MRVLKTLATLTVLSIMCAMNIAHADTPTNTWEVNSDGHVYVLVKKLDNIPPLSVLDVVNILRSPCRCFEILLADGQETEVVVQDEPTDTTVIHLQTAVASQDAANKILAGFRKMSSLPPFYKFVHNPRTTEPRFDNDKIVGDLTEDMDAIIDALKIGATTTQAR